MEFADFIRQMHDTVDGKIKVEEVKDEPEDKPKENKPAIEVTTPQVMGVKPFSTLKPARCGSAEAGERQLPPSDRRRYDKST